VLIAITTSLCLSQSSIPEKHAGQTRAGKGGVWPSSLRTLAEDEVLEKGKLWKWRHEKLKMDVGNNGARWRMRAG